MKIWSKYNLQNKDAIHSLTLAVLSEADSGLNNGVPISTFIRLYIRLDITCSFLYTHTFKEHFIAQNIINWQLYTIKLYRSLR